MDTNIIANYHDLARFVTHRPSSFVFAVFLVEQNGRTFELVGTGPEFHLVYKLEIPEQFCKRWDDVWTFTVVDKSVHLKHQWSVVHRGGCDSTGNSGPDPIFPLRVKRYYVETSRLFLLFVVQFRMNTDVAREVAQFLGDGVKTHRIVETWRRLFTGEAAGEMFSYTGVFVTDD